MKIIPGFNNKRQLKNALKNGTVVTIDGVAIENIPKNVYVELNGNDVGPRSIAYIRQVKGVVKELL